MPVWSDQSARSVPICTPDLTVRSEAGHQGALTSEVRRKWSVEDCFFMASGRPVVFCVSWRPLRFPALPMSGDVVVGFAGVNSQNAEVGQDDGRS